MIFLCKSRTLVGDCSGTFTISHNYLPESGDKALLSALHFEWGEMKVQLTDAL
jgi:hypothetical protein